MQECKITFGRVIKNARQYHGFSQRDLCRLIADGVPPRKLRYGCLLSHYELSKIENNRVDVRTSDYDWLIPLIAKIFDADIDWLEEIRQQTEVEPLDLSQAMFPIYFKP